MHLEREEEGNVINFSESSLHVTSDHDVSGGHVFPAHWVVLSLASRQSHLSKTSFLDGSCMSAAFLASLQCLDAWEKDWHGAVKEMQHLWAFMFLKGLFSCWLVSLFYYFLCFHGIIE